MGRKAWKTDPEKQLNCYLIVMVIRPMIKRQQQWITLQRQERPLRRGKRHLSMSPVAHTRNNGPKPAAREIELGTQNPNTLLGEFVGSPSLVLFRNRLDGNNFHLCRQTNQMLNLCLASRGFVVFSRSMNSHGSWWETSAQTEAGCAPKLSKLLNPWGPGHASAAKWTKAD